jgi:16S rRNA (adenine1518-N6/adenine1519-N6)-dimethyltransferase
VRERGHPWRRKRLGQHFLHDPRVIDHIIEAIGPRPGEALVEIGPGRGALTVPLLERAGVLHAIEVDARLAESLERRCRGMGELHVHRGDAVAFDFGAIGLRDMRVVGNLPYSVSTPLLFHLLRWRGLIREMVFMLQKEVVDRLCAEPGGGEYGRLTVTMQAACEVESLFTVGRGAFKPPPKVESAVVRIRPQLPSEQAIRDQPLFERVVLAAFGQRRKMLRNVLQDVAADPVALLESLGLDPRARAQNLSVTDFIRIANTLAGK